MAKRSAVSDINHTNWYQEEEPEDAGVFQKANSDVLETRVIKTAKRRAKLDGSSDSKPSPFSGFAGFGTATSTSNIGSPFSFLSQNKPKPTDESKANGTGGQDSILSNATKEAQPQFKSFTNSPFSGLGQSKDNISSLSPSSGQKNSGSTDTSFKPFENIFKSSKPSAETDKKSQNLELLKDLNLSCSSWIAEHLEKNPYCILTPIFKDYEKHLDKLDLNAVADPKGGCNDKTESETPSTATATATETAKPFSFSKEESSESSRTEKEEKKGESEKPKMPEFQFGAAQSKPLNLQFGSVNSTSFGTSSLSSSPFSLNQIAAKPISTMEDTKKDDEESEEPPKSDFVPVVEEDSIYDIKCKVFVKKEGNFVSRGVGTLFLKPVKDSKKTQLVVRAHTNLGNILLNTLLTPGLPIQKNGKNNAMIVCVPTPESKPPPVPVLIRVKTSEDCDALIKKLEECRES